ARAAVHLAQVHAQLAREQAHRRAGIGHLVGQHGVGLEAHRRRTAAGGRVVHRRPGDVVGPAAGRCGLYGRIVLLGGRRLALGLRALPGPAGLPGTGTVAGVAVLAGLGPVVRLGVVLLGIAFAAGVAAGLDGRHQRAFGDLVVHRDLDLPDHAGERRG